MMDHIVRRRAMVLSTVSWPRMLPVAAVALTSNCNWDQTVTRETVLRNYIGAVNRNAVMDDGVRLRRTCVRQ